MRANTWHKLDKKDYETTYATYLAEEKRAWIKWRKLLALNLEWKYLSPGLKNGFRHTHMSAFCLGANIPTLVDFLNLKETERARGNVHTTRD